MLKIRRILAPTDFSECGDAAIPWAQRMARVHDAQLHLLHAVPEWKLDSMYQLHDSTDREELEGILRHRADRRLRDRAANLPVTTEVHVARGGRHAGSAIASYAAEHAFDLIVMGTHGHRGLRRYSLGSVTQDVLRRAARPVLTVRPDPTTSRAPARLRSILVPIDFSWCSHLAFSYAQALAAAHGATLNLLHVVNETMCPESYFHYSQLTHDGRLCLEIEAERRLIELAKGVGDSGTDGRVFVRSGRPADEIVRFARESDSDLILLASHGLGGLLRVMLGSVTSQVVHATPASVLVTHWGRRMVPDVKVLSTHYSGFTSTNQSVGTDHVALDTKTTMQARAPRALPEGD